MSSSIKDYITMSIPLSIVHGGCISLFVDHYFEKYSCKHKDSSQSRHADRTVALEITLTDRSALRSTDLIYLVCHEILESRDARLAVSSDISTFHCQMKSCHCI